ncbi:MAG: hypothetical protein VX498_03205, partial [Myxococcota bacterium]|nr:hypothetical protein [Myxococcota bacterium]
MKVRPSIVGIVLCALSVAVFVLNAIESPRPPPHTLSALSTIRIILGLPIVLFVPAIFVVPFLMRPSVGRRGRSDGPLDLLWTLIAAAGLNVGFHFLHFQLLNLIGQGSGWLSLAVIAVVECFAGLALLHFKGSHLEFDPVSWKLLQGLGYGTLVLGFVLAGMGPKLKRDSSWYFYNSLMDVGWEATEDRGAIEISWADGTPFVDGVEFVRRSRIMQLVIENNSSEMQRVPLLFLVHGPVGTNIWLKRTTPPGQIWDVPQIATATPLEEGGRKVERYYHWGTASITGLECRDDPTEPPYNPNQICEGIQVPAEGLVLIELHIRPYESHWGNDPNHTWVAAWARLSTGEIQDELGSRGHQHMHPYQLLNVTENVRWAEEIASGTYVLPGRPTRDETASQEPALAQPPAWSYVYAPARRLLSEQTAVAAALLVCMLLALVVLGLKGIEDETGKAPLPVLGVVLGFTALQWGQLMVRDGSMNFPDNLYALGLAVSVVALCSGRT